MTRTIDDTDEKSPSGISPYEANKVMIDQLADHALKESLCGKKVNAKTTPDEEVPKWQRSPIVANEKKKKKNNKMILQECVDQRARTPTEFRSAWAPSGTAPRVHDFRTRNSYNKQDNKQQQYGSPFRLDHVS